MSNIPDFVLQVQEAERNLKAQWQIVQKDWHDEAAKSFNENIMDIYCWNFGQYITGKDIKGYGIDKLMQQMDKHMQDMSKLTGISANVAFAYAAGPQHNGMVNNWFDEAIDVENLEMVKDRGGVVHNENRDRDYWDNNPYSRTYDGVKPGELQNEDVKKIMNQKQ